MKKISARLVMLKSGGEKRLMVAKKDRKNNRWHIFFRMGGFKIWKSPDAFWKQMDKERAELREINWRYL